MTLNRAVSSTPETRTVTLRHAVALGTALLVALAAGPAEAQDGFPRHGLFGELGGQGVGLSVNYEYRPLRQLALRAGVATLPFAVDGDWGVGVGAPIGVNLLAGNSHHGFELGLAYAAFLGGDDLRFIVPSVGYRYYGQRRPWFMRVTANVLIESERFSENEPRQAVPYLGFSMGRSW